MAGSGKRSAGGWNPARRSRETPKSRLRVLTASAQRLDITSRSEARLQRSLRQNWQLDAWTYRDSIGELRYALNFLANCASRMRLYPAALSLGSESDVPITLENAEAPQQIIDACNAAIRDLGDGRMAMANLLHSTSSNFSVCGEGFLLGQEDPETGHQSWTVRSIDEIVVYNDQIMLREGPMTARGDLGLIDLNPDFTFVSRIWQPHPRYRMFADSALRAIMNEAEALLILRRVIRATGRSRLAGRGLLLVPDELSIATLNNDSLDPDADSFMNDLIDMLVTPIANEGDASAVAPGVIRGPMEALKEIRHIDFSASFDEYASKTREELLGSIATGLDLPKEIIMGVADLNHWSAWQVDDNTFRHHVEPHVISIVDSLTAAFLRPYLEGAGLDPDVLAQWLPRIMFWYDPTELVTHPDQTANAKMAHDALALSDSAFRRVLGFTEADAPDAAEIELRMIRTTRNFPPNLLIALMHLLDPTLKIPAMSGPPALPGAGPEGVIVPESPVPGMAAPTSSAAPTDSVTPTPNLEAPPIAKQPTTPVTASGLEAFVASMTDEERAVARRVVITTLLESGADPFSLTASRKPKRSENSLRLSRQLQQIDADLRARLIVAANAAMQRQLEKAGTRLRAKVSKNEKLRTKIAMTRAEHVGAHLGKDVVEQSGLTASSLMTSDWDTFKDQFYSWTGDAQKRALAVAAQLAGVSESASYRDAERALSKNLDSAWEMLSGSMDKLAQGLLYNPDVNLTTDEILSGLKPTSLIPTGTIRAAVGVAGGATAQDFGLVMTKAGVDVPAIALGASVGQIGTGSTISGFLKDAGCQTSDYEWVHGPSKDTFEPHLNLDGVEFTSFTDPALANTGDFPNNAFFLPGDHAGCLCDFMPLWITDQDVADARAIADARDAASTTEDVSVIPDNASALTTDTSENIATNIDSEIAEPIDDPLTNPALDSFTRTEPMTIQQAENGANPKYNGKHTSGYSRNCARVANTYEMRRRGYDVAANIKDKWTQVESLYLHKTWESFDGTPTKNLMKEFDFANRRMDLTASDEAEEFIKANYPDQSRGVMQFYYSRSGGHVINWELDGDIVKWVDAQGNGSRNVDEIKKNIDHGTHTHRFLRLDNLRPTEFIKNYFAGGKK